jgi:hypothetical protein
MPGRIEGLGRFDGESLTPSEQRFGGSYEGDADGGERSSTEMSHVDYNDAHFWKLRPPSLRASEPTSMWQFSFLCVLKRRFSTSLFGQSFAVSIVATLRFTSLHPSMLETERPTFCYSECSCHSFHFITSFPDVAR